MSFKTIAITRSQRLNLAHLKRVEFEQGNVQRHLTSGRKVEQPKDDVINYFRAKALTDRASDYSEHKQAMDQGISLLKESIDGLEGIIDYLDVMRSLIQEVRSLEERTTERAVLKLQSLQHHFEESGIQLMQLAIDSHYQGTNLIANNFDHKIVRLGEKSGDILNLSARDILGERLIAADRAMFSVQFFRPDILRRPDKDDFIKNNHDVFIQLEQFDFIRAIVPAGTVATFTSFGANLEHRAELDQLMEAFNIAKKRVKRRQGDLAINISILQARTDYSSNLINEHLKGTDKFTLADQTQEGAYLVALSTRQELAINALSVSGRQQAAVLRLIRSNN